MWKCREWGVEWVVSSALAAGGVKHGDVGLHVGRHYSIRDLITWCNRMQVRHLCNVVTFDMPLHPLIESNIVIFGMPLHSLIKSNMECCNLEGQVPGLFYARSECKGQLMQADKTPCVMETFHCCTRRFHSSHQA